MAQILLYFIYQPKKSNLSLDKYKIMPYKIHKLNYGYKVTSPTGVRAKRTTKKKAEAQVRLLRAKEHGGKPK